MAQQTPIQIAWVLGLTFAEAERNYHAGALTDQEWDAYRAIWQYSAPRFSEIAGDFGRPWPRVREINAQLDARGI